MKQKKVLTKEQVRKRNRALAKDRELERKKVDRTWFNALKHPKKNWTDLELMVYREACEEYAAKLKAFKSGKIVKGKGKNQTIKIVPHPAEPSFSAIYKSHAKAAGLYRKTA